MVIPKIVEFAAKQLVDGKSIEDVSDQLRSVGWNAHDVEDSMAEALREAARIPKRRKNRGKNFLLFIVLFLTISAAGAYYVYQTLPEVILDRAVRTIPTIKTAEYDFRIETDISGIQQYVAYLSEDPTDVTQETNTILTVKALGNFDIKNPKNPSASMEISTKTPESTGKSQDIAAKLMLINKVGYFALTKLPDVPFFDDPTYFVNQWTEQTVPEVTINTNLIPADLSIQQKLAIRQKAIESGFISISRASSAEVVEAVPVHTIAYTIDFTKFTTFYTELTKIYPSAQPLSEEQKSAIAELNKSISKPVSGMILIGKGDGYIYRISSTVDFATNDSPIGGTVQTTLTLRKHNASFTYEKPEGVISMEAYGKRFEQIIEKALVTSSLDLSRVEDREKKRAYDLTSIGEALKSYIADNHKVEDLGAMPKCAAGNTPIGTGSASLNLKLFLVPNHILSIPVDPLTGNEKNSGYTICVTPDTDVILTASNKESKVALIVHLKE